MITISMLASALATLTIGVVGATQPTQPTQQPQQLPRPDFSQLSTVMVPEREALDARYRQVEAVRIEKLLAEKDALRDTRRVQRAGIVPIRLFADN